MDYVFLLKAFFLGIIEGLTEFLPISSTGHLIVLGDWISFNSGEGKVFEVVIQLGAILAVCWIYRERIRNLIVGFFTGSREQQRFAGHILLAFFPAAILGALFIGTIKSVLFTPLTVAIALIVGGIVILLLERRTQPARIHSIEEMRWYHALLVGVTQCFALIPGTSRSGSTIVGGLLAGLSRQTATEFSFFLAIPTMLGAALYDGYRHRDLVSTDEMGAIVIGFLAAFVSAMLVVRALVRFIAAHSFEVFAWYRIALGLLILGMLSLHLM